ncbi:MAG: phage terminase large subunit [Actinobacteria bacterium]|nr:phage terminase large subunit [Actinomycetota bacterium]
MIKKKITNDDIEKQMKNGNFRRELARESPLWFFTIYLHEYIKYPTASFQKEMFELVQAENKSAVITAFRGSAKSTIASLTYPIWAMITEKKKFIIILSQNQSQCKLILANIRSELERNSLLISDFGPFKQIDDEWSQHTLLVNAYGCRISCISSGESIRGIKHKQHRPDLIIFDDVEDVASVKTKESRDKTFSWVTREVIPAGDINTKTIVIGNKLHEDGLMMRLKKAIEQESFSATYMEYPLLDENGICAWPQKFKTGNDIQSLKVSVGSESAWQREYLLKIVSEEDAVILSEWIKYYDDFPHDKILRYIATGIDLAISKSSSADYTAMVSAAVFGHGQDLKIYILPKPVNERLDFPQTVERAKFLSKALGKGSPTKLFIEEVAYQSSLIQELKMHGFPAEGVKVMGSDKRQRLSITAPQINNGSILFPKKGCEALIGQLVGFGYEAHDDLADAFAILVSKINQGKTGFGIKLFEIKSGEEI